MNLFSSPEDNTFIKNSKTPSWIKKLQPVIELPSRQEAEKLTAGGVVFQSGDFIKIVEDQLISYGKIKRLYSPESGGPPEMQFEVRLLASRPTPSCTTVHSASRIPTPYRPRYFCLQSSIPLQRYLHCACTSSCIHM